METINPTTIGIKANNTPYKTSARLKVPVDFMPETIPLPTKNITRPISLMKFKVEDGIAFVENLEIIIPDISNPADVPKEKSKNFIFPITYPNTRAIEITTIDFLLS